MRNMPNYKLTETEYIDIRCNPLAGGSEGVICEWDQNSVVKFFSEVYANITQEQIEAIRENKLRKLIALYKKNLQNPILPIATVSKNGQFIGYVMTKGIGTNGLQVLQFDWKTKLQLLRKSKELLMDFHEQGIINGDVRLTNVLFDRTTGNAAFCDLDNMQVDGYLADLIPTIVKNYQKLRGVPIQPYDQTVDIVLHNTMMLQLFCNTASINPEVLERKPIDEYLNEEGKQILIDYKHPKQKIKQGYLCDYLIK